MKSLPPGWVQRCESEIRGSVVELEEINHLRRRERIIESVHTAGQIQMRYAGAQTLAHGRFVAPQQRRRHIRRSDELSDGFEHLTDEARCGPVRHSDGSVRNTHAEE